MPQTIQLTEALTMTGTNTTMLTGDKMRIALITPGWGASGYYSPAVLEAAAAAKVFPAGLHMYVDHQGEEEFYDRARVGRTIRDLAAVLTTDATWDGSALVAEAQVFTPYAAVLAEMKDAIGVSIRGDAAMESGEAEGRTGVIVTEIVRGTSADFVSRPGRGGKILQVLESARTRAEDAFTPTASLVRLMESRNVGQWIESRMHLDFTRQADDMFGDGRLSREERIAMSGAVGAALDAFTTSLEASAPQLYLRDLWDDPEDIAMALEAAMPAFLTAKVKCVTCKHLGSAHADMKGAPNSGACSMKGCDCTAMKAPAAKESAALTTPVVPAGNEKEITMPQIEEARLSQLEADSGRVPVLEAERNTATEALTAMTTERDTAIAESATLRESALVQARALVVSRIIGEAAEAAHVTLDRWQIAGLSADAPLGADHLVDEAALRTRVDTALAALAEAAGAGKVTGFGHSVPAATEITEAARDAIYDIAFDHPKGA